jgi:hypothetical protein
LVEGAEGAGREGSVINLRYNILQIAPAPAGLMARYVDAEDRKKHRGNLPVHFCALCEVRQEGRDEILARKIHGVTMVGDDGGGEFAVCEDIDHLIDRGGHVRFAGLFLADAPEGNAHKVFP